MTDDNVAQDENLRLAELRFRAFRGDTEAVATLKKDLIERKALPLYSIVSVDLVRCQLRIVDDASTLWKPCALQF